MVTNSWLAFCRECDKSVHSKKEWIEKHQHPVPKYDKNGKRKN